MNSSGLSWPMTAAYSLMSIIFIHYLNHFMFQAFEGLCVWIEAKDFPGKPVVAQLLEEDREIILTLIQSQVSVKNVIVNGMNAHQLEQILEIGERVSDEGSRNDERFARHEVKLLSRRSLDVPCRQGKVLFDDIDDSLPEI